MKEIIKDKKVLIIAATAIAVLVLAVVIGTAIHKKQVETAARIAEEERIAEEQRIEKENKRVADTFSQKLSKLEKDLPTRPELNALKAEYETLNAEQKSMVQHYELILTYENMNLEAMNDIQNSIDQIGPDTSFGSLCVLKEEMNKLTTDERDCLQGADKIENAMEMTNYDKAGVAAARFLRNNLKNENSLEISDIRLKEEGGYYVVIDYHAMNGFGGINNDAICVDINKDYSTGLIALSLLTGRLKESSNINYRGYLGFKGEEIELDPEKIMYYIDTDVRKNK